MSENGVADKSAILAANKRRYVNTSIPGIGDIRIRSMNERERGKYEQESLGSDNTVDISIARVRLIIQCVCNAEGRRIFSDADKDAIGDMDGIVTHLLGDMCMSHCGFGDNDIEVLAKNLESTADDDSPTG